MMPIYTFVQLQRPRRALRGGRFLFSSYDLAASLERQTNAYEAEISGFDVDYLANADIPELIDYLHEKYIIEIPVLLQDKIEWSEKPGKLDISQDRNRDIYDRSRPYYIDGTAVTFHLPVEGQAEIFDCAPSVIYMREGPPQGKVVNGELQFEYVTENVHPPALQQRLDADLQRLLYVWKDVERALHAWNLAAQSGIAQTVSERVARIQRMQSGFKFPLRRRVDAVTSAPVRKKILPPRAYGEPRLAMQQYEEVLTTIQNSATALERAPSAFAEMDEEDIRQYLLIALNAVFEGNAGAEVFTVSGKTDILIKADGKTIFIAECKFWKGGASLTRAIDQLLRYTSWQDNKTALVILNRGRAMSTVLRSIPEVFKKHPAYVREEEYGSENGYRYTLHHRNDPEREILVTVLVFDVPTQTHVRSQ